MLFTCPVAADVRRRIPAKNKTLARLLTSAATLLITLIFQPVATQAGGSGLNLVVVVNQNSPDSLQLGNEYCQLRQVPPQNLFRMTEWTRGAVTWSRTDFETFLRGPLLAQLASSGLTNQIQYVLLSKDIPYRIVEGDSDNSTTAALFYGFKTNTPPPPYTPVTCSLPDYSSNSFAFSELPFDQARPDTADTNGFMTFMLTDSSLAAAEAIITRGLAGDSTFPTQTVYLQKTSDWARNVRFFSFDDAIFDTRVRGDADLVRMTSDFKDFHQAGGLLTGSAGFSLPPDAFAPGALGDSMTSFAGYIFENSGQTSLLEFLNAGATASYGTITEPCNWLQKFPDPLVYVYQRRGFCLAEAYWQSVWNPFQGLFVGEPLSAPFARPGQSSWGGLTNGTVLSGQAVLPPAFFSAATDRLLSQVDFFIDGQFIRTLTNVPPAPGNLLSVSVNGTSLQYQVPGNATLGSVATNLANNINLQSNATRVAATARGDRLELHSFDISTPGSNVPLSASSSIGSASQLTTSLAPARPEFLDTVATGYVIFEVTNTMVQGDWLQLQITKTNGAQFSISVTNNTADTNVADLCQSLMDAVNATPTLQDPDGVLASDLMPQFPWDAVFLIYSRSPGWPAARIQTQLTTSLDLGNTRPGIYTLEDNIAHSGQLPASQGNVDLHPRNHLYVSSGLNELTVNLLLDTSTLSDGFHELTLVGYEGTSVRTQTHVSRTVQVRNTGLAGQLLPEVAGTNVTPDTPLVITVTANTNTVIKTELFSTGGLLDVVSNQQVAHFNVPLSFLGVGVHPFYALLTDQFGNQFRTQTTYLHVLPSISLTIAGTPLMLSWSAVPGLQYDVLSAMNVLGPFTHVDTVTATSTTAQWLVTPNAAGQTFFRLQLAR